MEDTLDARFEKEREAAPDLVAKRAREQLRAQMFGEPVRPTQVGRFVVEGTLGRGGMGVVHAAVDPELRRPVAIKVLLDSWSDKHRRMLVDEAQALAKISHPNVVTVYEVGTHDDHVFIVMERIDGVSLADWVQARQPTWREVVRMYCEAARGLEAAHKAGLVHRDFKPHNVLVGKDGRPRVVDFGLARPGVVDSSEDEDPDTLQDVGNERATSIAGTPAYMAPEVIEGRIPDAPADQFSFCASLWETLYGGPPFERRSLQSLLDQENEQLVPPSDERGVPRRIRALLERGLAKDPGDRHPSVQALRLALSDALLVRRRRVLLGAGGGVLVLAAGAGYWLGGREEPMCSAAAAELDSVWNEPRRESLMQALRQTGLPGADAIAGRVVASADAYAAAWSQSAREACEATNVRGVQSERTLDARMLCLRERRRALGHQLDVIEAQPQETLSKAAASLEQLPPIEACGREGLGEAEPLPDDDESTSILADAARVEALARAGLYAEALQAGEGLVTRAEQVGHDALLARVLLTASEMHHGVDDGATARELSERAYWAGLDARDDEAALIAAIQLVSAAGVTGGDYDEAKSWGRSAQGLIRRFGFGELRQLDLDRALGSAAIVAGKTEDAAQIFEDVVARARSMPDVPPRALGQVIARLSYVRGRARDLTAALELAREAVELSEQADGPDHPATTSRRFRLASILYERGEYDEAEVVLEQVLHDFEAWKMEEDVAYGMALDVMAAIKEAKQDYETAREIYDRSLEYHRRAFGEQHPNFARVLDNSVSVVARTGEVEEARRRNARAREIFVDKIGPDSLEVAISWGALASLEYEAGNPDAALAAVRRSNEAYASAQTDPSGYWMNWLLEVRIHGERGDWKAADEPSARALEVLQESEAGEYLLADALLWRGVVLHEIGDPEGSKLIDQSFAIYRSNPSMQAQQTQAEQMLDELDIAVPKPPAE